MERYGAWVAFIERRQRWILAASLLLTLASAASLLALRFDFDVLDMLPTGAPAFDNFKTFVADFGELDELIVLVGGPHPETLHRFADAFTERLRHLDTVAVVQGRIDPDDVRRGVLGRYVYNYLPVEAYAELRGQLTAEGIEAQVRADRAILQAPFDLSAAQMVRNDPLGLTRLAGQALGAGVEHSAVNLNGGYLSTPDGHALLLFVRPTRGAFDIPFTTHFMQEVRAAETASRPVGADVRVGYTGSYAFALEDAATLKWDVARYTLLALLGVLLVFYLTYRNLRILPFVTYPLIISTLVTFAASLLCYAQLNAVSLSFAAILYGLSIDSGIQYYTRLIQELRHADRRAAVTRTLANLGAANVVASATTAAAFAVIGASRLIGVSQLGVLTAIGMLVNILQFFILYPALSFWMPRAALIGSRLDAPWLGRLATGAAAYARALIVALVVVSAALLLLARGVQFDVDLTHLRPAGTPAAYVQDEIARRFGASIGGGAVLVHAADLETALERSEALVRRLVPYQTEGFLKRFQAVAALLPSAAAQRERLALFSALPRQQVVAALRAALQREGFVPTQFEGFMSDFVVPHDALVQWGDAALQPFAPLLARHVRQRADGFTVATYVEPMPETSLGQLGERLRRELPDVPFIVAGRQLLQEELGRLLHREVIGFCIASFVLNLLLVLASFPRPGLATAILMPEALIIIALLALMAVTRTGIDPVNLIVVPLILGIGVDNCVYVGARYQRGEAVGEAVYNGGRALAVCALTTMTGFGFLGLSHYPALARMGVLAALSLLLCFVASVTVLPALVVVLDTRRRGRAGSG